MCWGEPPSLITDDQDCLKNMWVQLKESTACTVIENVNKISKHVEDPVTPLISMGRLIENATRRVIVFPRIWNSHKKRSLPSNRFLQKK